jgi:two-component system OmpR family response regulator
VGAIVSALGQLTPQERAVLDALAARSGRVVSRSELARAVGVADLSERRCDSLVVAVRRAVGAERVVTVRRRGWMLVAA